MEQFVTELVRVNNLGTQFGKDAGDAALARSNAAGESKRSHAKAEYKKTGAGSQNLWLE